MSWLRRLRELWKKLLSEGSSPGRLAIAVFVGVFVSVTPFYGLQMLLVIALAAVFRLNKVAALIAVQLSIPPIYPFLVIASLETGSLLLYGDWAESTDLPETTADAWRMLGDLGGVWLLGSLIVGTVLGGLTAALVYILALKSPQEEAIDAELEYKESQRLTALSESAVRDGKASS